MKRCMTSCISTLLVVCGLGSYAAFAEPIGNEELAAVLAAHVEDGRVDYAALQAEPQQLNGWLERVAQVNREDFIHWSSASQQSFLINVYNAATLKLIIENYPVDSIKDIGGFFSGPWSKKFVQLFGEAVSLDYVEHDVLRNDYNEPRLHFALVCAAKGCPPLLAEPYEAKTLDAQLDQRGYLFFLNSQKNRVAADQGIVYLSPIFKWFKEDFGDDRIAVLDYVKNWFPKEQVAGIDFSRYQLRYTDYDWSLNDIAATDTTPKNE